MQSELLSVLIPYFPPLRIHAYLDPGSGSFLIQLLIAGLVGLGFIVKGYWGKIKSLFNRSASKPDAQKPDDPAQQ